jgi:ankyrin repeat protein
VKYLIENNANINNKDDKNNTGLHIAVKNDDYNMVKLLINNNAKINVINNDKETPIDIAKKKKNNLIYNLIII